MELPTPSVALSRSDLQRAAVVCFLLGAVAIVFPHFATIAIETLFGALLVIFGSMSITYAVVNRQTMSYTLPMGVLDVIIGALLLFRPLEGAVTLTALLIFWCVVVGVLRLWTAWRLRQLQSISGLVFSGIVALVLALLLKLNWPADADWAIGLLLGSNLVALGLALMLLARQQSRLQG